MSEINKYPAIGISALMILAAVSGVFSFQALATSIDGVTAAEAESRSDAEKSNNMNDSSDKEEAAAIAAALNGEESRLELSDISIDISSIMIEGEQMPDSGMLPPVVSAVEQSKSEERISAEPDTVTPVSADANSNDISGDSLDKDTIKTGTDGKLVFESDENGKYVAGGQLDLNSFLDLLQEYGVTSLGAKANLMEESNFNDTLTEESKDDSPLVDKPEEIDDDVMVDDMTRDDFENEDDWIDFVNGKSETDKEEFEDEEDNEEEEEEDSPEQVEIMGEDRTIDPQDYIVVEGNE